MVVILKQRFGKTQFSTILSFSAQLRKKIKYLSKKKKESRVQAFRFTRVWLFLEVSYFWRGLMLKPFNDYQNIFTLDLSEKAEKQYQNIFKTHWLV